MSVLVIDRETLPPTLSQFFDGSKVSVKKKGGRVILSSKNAAEKRKEEMERAINRLCGIFSDGKISVDDFLRQRER